MLSVVQAHKLVDLGGIISELFLDRHPVIVFVNSAAKVDTIFKVERVWAPRSKQILSPNATADECASSYSMKKRA